MIDKKNVFSHNRYPEAEPTNSGDVYRTEYIKAYKEDGTPYLKKVGQTDIQKEINNNCPPLVNEYVQRFMYGDKNALNVKADVTYADVSEVPSLGELTKMRDSVQTALNTIEFNAQQAALNQKGEETVNAES